MNRIACLLLVAAFAPACSGGGGGGGDGGSASSADSPVIQSLTADPLRVTPATGTQISAIVSDPQGITDLAGGTLTDTATGVTYGAFGTPGGQGTFAFAVTWDMLNAASEIDLAASTTARRTLTAKFFDNEGNTVTQELTITLECATASEAACGGTCVDLASNVMNCGACGQVCASNLHGSTMYASCRAAKCTWSEGSTSRSSCDAVCGALGAACAASTCPYMPDGAVAGYTTTADDLGCSTTPPSVSGGGTFTGVECCCQQ